MARLQTDLNRLEEMKKMRAEGMNSTEIAEHFNISRQRVSFIFGKYDKPVRNKITSDDIKSIQDPEKIAEKFDITVTWARKRMRDEGIVIPRKKIGPRSKFTQEFTAMLYADYLTGLNQKAIGAKYGIAQNTVSMLFSKYGFKAEKRGWPKGKERK